MQQHPKRSIRNYEPRWGVGGHEPKRCPKRKKRKKKNDQINEITSCNYRGSDSNVWPNNFLEMPDFQAPGEVPGGSQEDWREGGICLAAPIGPRRAPLSGPPRTP